MWKREVWRAATNRVRDLARAIDGSTELWLPRTLQPVIRAGTSTCHRTVSTVGCQRRLRRKTRVGNASRQLRTRRRPSPEPLRSLVRAALGFIVGVPLGLAALARAIAWLWSAMLPSSSPAPAGVYCVLAIIIPGGFCLRARRYLFGWLAFGSGCGLFVAAFLIGLFWGWHGS
jgi:hypothetical protein